LLATCDNTGEPLAWMLRPGSAGSNTAADHLQVLGEAIEALPPRYRRRLMVTCDGAGASHDLVRELDRLASRRGYEVTWSVGWALGERERAAIGSVPDGAARPPTAAAAARECRPARAPGPGRRCGCS
jgi:hypothetical protein